MTSTSASSGFAPDQDPFGSRPTRRRRGWSRVLLGLALLAGGIAAVVAGIVGAVEAHGRIEGDAVGRGIVREGEPGAVAFTVPPGERRQYTVYLLFEGFVSDDEEQELTVRDSGCLATLPDGAETVFRGARQDVSMTLGNAASVGHFSAQPGPVRISCGYTSGTRRSERRRPERIAFVVTPGRPSGPVGAILLIVGGVAAALLGGALLIWGLVGGRR